MKLTKTLLMIAMLSIATPTLAQPHIRSTVQNMHLWRGGEVADGIVVTTDLYYSDPTGHIEVGLWGGTNGVGEYKEFDYYLRYNLKGFSITLFDTYNFSTYATYNNTEFFNYRADETGRFLDANLVYSFGEKFPLTVSWATILFGRDRDELNEENLFSTFCSASYTVYKKEKWTIDTGVGVAFALNEVDSSANFYGDKAGIVEATLRATYHLAINGYEMPITTTAMWNPQSNQGYLQLSLQLLSF